MTVTPQALSFSSTPFLRASPVWWPTEPPRTSALPLPPSDLAEVITGQAGGRQVVGLDQAGDVVVLDRGVDGDDRDAGGLGLGQGVVPAAGVGGADDDAGHLLGDGVVDGALLRLGVLDVGGQVDELDAPGRRPRPQRPSPACSRNRSSSQSRKTQSWFRRPAREQRSVLRPPWAPRSARRVAARAAQQARHRPPGASWRSWPGRRASTVTFSWDLLLESGWNGFGLVRN